MESGYSALESVEDNEALGISENLDNSGGSVNMDEKDSGMRDGKDDEQSGGDVNDKKAVEVEDPVSLPPEVVVVKGLDLGLVSGSLSPETANIKGRGLRKWRRIKRDVTSDGVVSVDSSRLLKRDFSNARVHSGKSMQYPTHTKQNSEGSVSSTNALMRSPGMMGGTFASRMDSENSDSRSSKSSKSVTGPSMRYEGPVVMGHLPDKNKMKSLSGKSLGSSVQRGQQSNVRMETTKKHRGDRFKIEKETSHSSMESDSRSSNFIFVQGTNSLTGNGRQNGRSMNYDGENSDEGQGNEGQVGEELRTGYGKRSDGDVEDVSQADLAAGSSCGGNEAHSENQECSTNGDSLSETIALIQSVQEALEKVLQEYKEVGTGDIFVDDLSQNSRFPSEFTSDGLEDHGPSSLEQLYSSDKVSHSLHASKSEINNLEENINVLESKLGETTAMLKLKESRVVELESNLGNDKDLESELDDLFRRKIEAEVEYLAISERTDYLRALSVDQISMLEKQKKIVSEQLQMQNKFEDAESRVVNLESEAEKLKNYCEDIVSADEALKLQSNVCKYTSCFFIQLVLLAVILGLLILQSSPESSGLVPT